jgi:hypothetical protein
MGRKRWRIRDGASEGATRLDETLRRPLTLTNEPGRRKERRLARCAAPGLLDHLLDHGVAASAVTAGPACPRDLGARARAPLDGLFDFAIGDCVADANVHELRSHMILNAIIISKPRRDDLA